VALGQIEFRDGWNVVRVVVPPDRIVWIEAPRGPFSPPFQALCADTIVESKQDEEAERGACEAR
jgi:hypothetical protein